MTEKLAVALCVVAAVVLLVVLRLIEAARDEEHAHMLARIRQSEEWLREQGNVQGADEVYALGAAIERDREERTL